MSRAHEVQQRQPIIDQVIFGTVQALHIAKTAVTLIPPSRRDPIVEFVGHPSVDLVDIELVQAVLQAIRLAPQPDHRLVSFPTFVCMALTQGPGHQPERLVIDPYLLE